MAAALLNGDIKGHASAVMVVLDIYPQIMREMIVNIFPPIVVLRLIQNEPNQTFLNQLKTTEKKMISKLDITGYNELDTSCLYKVIRYFNLLPPPKAGWGQKPGPEDKCEGDDVERMKKNRNDILHRPRGSLSESDKHIFFQQSSEIAKRIDIRNNSLQNSFESKIKIIQSSVGSMEKYISLLEKCAEYRAKLQETSAAQCFNLHYGQDIQIKLDAKIDNRTNGDSSSSCTIFLKDPDFDETSVIQMLDAIKEKIRTKSYGISLEHVEIGSLNIHVSILDKCFLTKEILHQSIQSFLYEFFCAASIPYMQGNIYTVVLADSSDLVLDNRLPNRGDLGYLKEKPSTVLKFNVKVKDSAFQNEFELYKEVNRFISGMYNAVDRPNVPDNGAAREVLMLTNEREENCRSNHETIEDPQLRSVSNMNLYDKSLSLQFYKCLCDIVGSEEVVRTRRDIFAAKDIVDNTSRVTVISTGSKAEGLDIKGSDYDIMCFPNCTLVYESLNNVQYDPGDIILFMDTMGTKPGFTKLKLANKSDLYTNKIRNWSETVGEETYISSKLFREIDIPGDMVIPGPCRSTADGQYDRAGCFRCKQWIKPSQQWIHRSRTTWPHHTLVTAAVQYGVLFVPIGCKNSPNEDLQWRISFSATEKLLVHSFSHTKLLCYALMKIILKDLIKPRHGDLLCSYFIKTIMFWLSEEIHPSGWKPENMISCFLGCIRRLIYCVEFNTCPHYFIPENNLFADRFTSNDHKAILETLRFVYGSPWTSVFHTETFLNYKLQSKISHRMSLSVSELSCFPYKRLKSNNCSMYSLFKRFGICYNHIFRKDICAYMLSACSMESIQSSAFYNLADKNKSFYKQYKRLFGHINISLQSDSITPWLLLSSLFYKCKRFRECLYIINYLLFSCNPDRIYVHFANSLAEQTVFKQMKQTLGLMHTFKYLIIEHIYFQYPYNLLPNELMSLQSGNSLHIPPGVYSYLLQFLCLYQLGDNRGTQNALHNLELTMQERYFFFPSEYYSGQVNTILLLVKSLIGYK